jgi:hypothetical protein
MPLEYGFKKEEKFLIFPENFWLRENRECPGGVAPLLYPFVW